MRISDWSSDVCSSDVVADDIGKALDLVVGFLQVGGPLGNAVFQLLVGAFQQGIGTLGLAGAAPQDRQGDHRQRGNDEQADGQHRSEEHTSELQSLMRISYAVFCLKKKNTIKT